MVGFHGEKKKEVRRMAVVARQEDPSFLAWVFVDPNQSSSSMAKSGIMSRWDTQLKIVIAAAATSKRAGRTRKSFRHPLTSLRSGSSD